MRAAVVVNVASLLTGVGFFGAFSTDFFDKISGNGLIMTFRLGCVKVFTGFMATWAIKRFGRRQLLSLGVLFQLAAFVSIYTLVSIDVLNLMFLAVGGYAIGQALGTGGLQITYTADILPAAGIGMALGLNWVLNSVSSKLIPLVQKK